VCRICRDARNKVRHAEDKKNGIVYPSHTAAGKRKDRLRPLGWTPELFERSWKEQEGKCAICKKTLNLEKVQNEARACADHEHVEPPKPRGILCTNCNVMLGQAKDSPRVLRAGALYLEKFSLETAEVVKHLTVSA
jgi:hypothetical protein